MSVIIELPDSYSQPTIALYFCTCHSNCKLAFSLPLSHKLYAFILLVSCASDNVITLFSSATGFKYGYVVPLNLGLANSNVLTISPTSIMALLYVLGLTFNLATL